VRKSKQKSEVLLLSSLALHINKTFIIWHLHLRLIGLRRAKTLGVGGMSAQPEMSKYSYVVGIHVVGIHMYLFYVDIST
jgi:hypothetical protein